MSAVLGIDVSSHAIDLVKLDETSNDAEWLRLDLHGDDAYQRLRDVQRAISYLNLSTKKHYSWFFDDVYIAGIEVPKSRYLKTAAALFPVYGAVVACLPPGLEMWDVHPKTWRQSIGLPGNASKEQVTDRVRRLMLRKNNTSADYVLWPQDAYDAYAVAYHVRETNRRAIEAIPHHPQPPQDIPSEVA